MKKNNGVSIITLVTTIVVLIILAGITIYYGDLENVEQTTDALAYDELINVSEAVSDRSLMNRLNSSLYVYVGTPITDTEPVEINGISYGSGWYMLESSMASELNLESVKKDYIVNYDTGEVVSLKPIYYENEEYYSSIDIKEAIGIGDTTVSADSYDQGKGVNKPLLVTGMVPVKLQDGNWVVTSATDPEWYDYSAEKSSWANVMLLDELVIQGYTNEQIREATLSELEGLTVTNSGSMYVWIPRYSSNAAGDIVFSNLLKDYNDAGFAVSSAFSVNGKQITGLWISKYDVEFWP